MFDSVLHYCDANDTLYHLTEPNISADSIQVRVIMQHDNIRHLTTTEIYWSATLSRRQMVTFNGVVFGLF